MDVEKFVEAAWKYLPAKYVVDVIAVVALAIAQDRKERGDLSARLERLISMAWGKGMVIVFEPIFFSSEKEIKEGGMSVHLLDSLKLVGGRKIIDEESFDKALAAVERALEEAEK